MGCTRATNAKDVRMPIVVRQPVLPRQECVHGFGEQHEYRKEMWCSGQVYVVLLGKPHKTTS